MKVFISWSGERSHYVAKELHDWIPNVIQAIEPWMSSEDIASGSQWLNEITKQLAESYVGIICLTPENQNAPWVMFESGAISKALPQSFVCPYLIDLEFSQIDTPLKFFQSNKATEEGTLKVLQTLNNALANPDSKSAPIRNLDTVFKKWWGNLEEKLNNLPQVENTQIKQRTTEEILEEILNNTREQLRRESIRVSSASKKDEQLDEFINILGFFNTINPSAHITHTPLIYDPAAGSSQNLTKLLHTVRGLSDINKQERQAINLKQQYSEQEEGDFEKQENNEINPGEKR